MKIAILAITQGGKTLATKLCQHLPDAEILEIHDGVATALAGSWKRFEGFICIMATGIVVRCLAPLLVDKNTDPAVVVMDQKGHYAISLLSGHLGGGNELAARAATITGGEAVITTASDTLGLVALDLWASKHHLGATKETLTEASARLVNQGSLKVFSDYSLRDLPRGLKKVSCREEAELVVSHHKDENRLCFYPKDLVVGIGCNRGTPLDEFEEAMDELFSDLSLSPLSIRNLASIDVKNDEKGLLAFAKKNGWSLEFFNRAEINRVTDLEVSTAAMKAVGAIGVAEPTALISAKSSQLLSRKRKWKNITMAVAQASFTL